MSIARVDGIARLYLNEQGLLVRKDQKQRPMVNNLSWVDIKRLPPVLGS